INEIMTCRRHCEAKHSGVYRAWAEKNGFESCLPGDIKKRKEEAAKVEQSRIEPHLKERPRIVKYTHKLFQRAAFKWLVATDQPVQALQHPKFKEMIDIASHATKGVKIPGRKTTCNEIIQLFKDNLARLRQWLNV
ncbi:hypothetical protein BV22DRAFT_979157, partial [Leucogyrophana mollusca]